MIPRYHIIYGLIFSLVFKLISESTNWFFIALIFLSSFLIDFDHYFHAVKNNKSLSLQKAFDYHKQQAIAEEKLSKKGIRKKSDFHLLHTIEFIVFIGILSFAWIGFFYIFVGLVFHSLLDLINMIYEGKLYRREFVLGNWITKKITKRAGFY